MKKDYSEYQLSNYDRYRILRSNRKNVTLDYFVNTVRFYPEDRSFIIRVDRGNEYHMMQEFLDEYDDDEQKRRGERLKPPSKEDEQEYCELRESELVENQQYRSAMKQKYKVDFNSYLEEREHYHPQYSERPLINIFSGSQIELHYGEGILDFLYADFITPLRPALKMYRTFAAIREKYQQENPETVAQTRTTSQKVYTTHRKS